MSRDMNRDWQKSSYCSEGEACVHIATATRTPATPTATIHLTESSDPAGAILKAPPAAFHAFLTTLKKNSHHG